MVTKDKVISMETIRTFFAEPVSFIPTSCRSIIKLIKN